jgi:hypothetical protein
MAIARKENSMKNYRTMASSAMLALLAAVSFVIPNALKAADSPEITKLLADAKAEAAELKVDSGELESFTRSTMTWRGYASKLDEIKIHINNTGKLLGKLKGAEATGSPWQQAAIKRIEPLLKELADNTTATINHLNDNPGKIHTPAFTDYVKANSELATDLEAVIRDFVNYGSDKEKFESLGSKLEVQP